MAVDIVSVPSRLLRFLGTPPHRLFIQASPDRVVERALEPVSLRDYDWVVVADDVILSRLRQRRDLPESARLALAPVTDVGTMGHITSRIGLSTRLEAAGLRTPPFEVVADIDGAQAAAERLGYPVVLKADSGSSGKAVVRADRDADLDSTRAILSSSLLLVQR